MQLEVLTNKLALSKKLDIVSERKKKVVRKGSGFRKKKFNVDEHKLMILGERRDYLV